MAKYTGWARMAGAVGAATLLLTACVEKKNDTLAQDSTLALAAQADTAQPQLRDVPAGAATTPAPATTAPAAPAPRTEARTTTTHTTTRPAPAPTRTTTPAPAPATPTTTSSGNTVTRGSTGGATGHMGTVAAGTRLTLSSNQRICTNTDKVGETVTATLQNAVTGSNGAVIPAGARATLEVTELKRSENVNDKIVIGFRVRSISYGGHTYPVDATVASAQVDRVKNQPSSKDAQKVATGAAIGAVAGQIIGHNTKSTVIGGAIGAAAGAGAAAATSNYEGCVPDGGTIAITLNSPLQVTT